MVGWGLGGPRFDVGRDRELGSVSLVRGAWSFVNFVMHGAKWLLWHRCRCCCRFGLDRRLLEMPLGIVAQSVLLFRLVEDPAGKQHSYPDAGR